MLAVEILSPSTRCKDHLLKRSKYEDAGVRSYWIVDPAQPSILVLDLVAGTYITTAEANGSARAVVNIPFSVEIVPVDLVAPAP